MANGAGQREDDSRTSPRVFRVCPPGVFEVFKGFVVSQNQ